MSKYTKGPWSWGKGWDKDINLNEYETFDKYEDLQLFGANQKEIIPIRIDHRQVIYDDYEDMPALCKADRDLIAAAPDMLEMLEKLIAEYKKLPTSLGYQFTHTPQAEALISKAKGE